MGFSALIRWDFSVSGEDTRLALTCCFELSRPDISRVHSLVSVTLVLFLCIWLRPIQKETFLHVA